MCSVAMQNDGFELDREKYSKRLQWWNDQHEGQTMGSNVLLPDEDTSDELLEAFDELMMDCGTEGIEYAQEALHQEGGDYFGRFFDSKEDVIEDFNLYVEMT